MENNEKQSCTIKTSVGGQALLEGIMMKGPFKSAMAVRKPNGEIEVSTCSSDLHWRFRGEPPCPPGAS